eukprot:XP_019925744.1 PREDICTED: uncharacterized protein LOC105335281 isoform X2 [Crassostrea gigas]
MTTFGSSFWIIILTTLSFSTAERRFIFDTFVKIQTQFESWQSWSPCSGSCGETGTRFRTRGCHHVMVGFLKFSHECPIEGEEKQTCLQRLLCRNNQQLNLFHTLEYGKLW